jgi:hypothetical protein
VPHGDVSLPHLWERLHVRRLHVKRPVALAEHEGGTIALCRHQQVLIVAGGCLLDEAGLLLGIRRSEEFANHACDVMGLAGGAVQVDFKRIGHGSDGAPAWRLKQVGGRKPWTAVCPSGHRTYPAPSRARAVPCGSFAIWFANSLHKGLHRQKLTHST